MLERTGGGVQTCCRNGGEGSSHAVENGGEVSSHVIENRGWEVQTCCREWRGGVQCML
jgi:hypothetical protein